LFVTPQDAHTSTGIDLRTESHVDGGQKPFGVLRAALCPRG